MDLIKKEEIRESLRKRAKTDINVKDEVMAALYSVLNVKNDNLIKNLIEIEDKISKEESKKSLFTNSIKGLLYVVCILAWVFEFVLVVSTIYFCFYGYLQESILLIIQLFLIEFLLVVILVVFHKSIKCMNKNDTYNSFMFIVTMIAFIITIFTTLK